MSIATIPMTYPGAGRRVYPGFLQLAGFMTMNLGNHMMSAIARCSNISSRATATART